MTRYIAIAKPLCTDWDDHQERLVGQSVIVEDDQPVDTGLVDVTGTRIYRASDRIPVGFRR